MTFFDKTTLEGLIFLDKGIISGFNKENDEFLNTISLNIKYYHGIQGHIHFLMNRVHEEFKVRFGKEPEIREHDKVGVFRWEPYFDLEEGYTYFVVTKKDAYNVTEISAADLASYNTRGFMVATSRDKIIDFIIHSGSEGEFIHKYLRKYTQKKLLVDGKLVDNPDVIDERCYQIPLFVVKDTEGIIQDKSGLVEVINIKFLKEGVCLQSLVKSDDVRKIFTKLGSFGCDFELKKEARYVSSEFATYM